MISRTTRQFGYFILTLLLVIATHPRAVRADYRIAVYHANLPGQDAATAQQLFALLDKSGYEAKSISTEQLSDPAFFSAASYDLVILPSCDVLPAQSIPMIERFVARGGDLLSLAAPAFGDPLWQVGDRWYSRADWDRQLASQRPKHILLSFDRPDELELWRASSDPDIPTVRKQIDGPQGKALEIHLDKMQGWDTLVSGQLDKPFATDDALTCLMARGSAGTRNLSFEWKERDGSRWIAVFSVTESWQHVTLTPGDFHYWQSVPQRGKPGDRFHPENAVQFAIGLARSHTGYQEGAQAYAVDQIGTALLPPGAPPASVLRTARRIEGLSPGYKFYSLHDVSRLRPRATWLQQIEALPTAPHMSAHHPRPTGKGIGKQRAWRWLPLIDAIGPNGEWRGAPVSMFVDFAGPAKGSVRCSIAVDEHAWYRQPAQQQMLLAIVRRMAAGIFFQEAGTDYFTYRPDQKILAGARVANLSRADVEDLTVRFTLHRPDQTQSSVIWTEVIRIAAGDTVEIQKPVSIPDASLPGTIRVELVDKDSVIDTIQHDISRFTPRPVAQRDFVTSRAGDFYLHGKKWYVHGVNYMPSTGIGIEDQPYFENWMGARSYDPEFIQRGLQRCCDMGLNSVSIFIHHEALAANNLLDILRRCDQLGLRVNLSLRPGTPLNYKWSQWREIIEQTRLMDLDVIYAYDIAWEPFFGRLEERRRYDPLWQKWIVQTYGSVERAEQVWQTPAPRFQNHVSSPSREQLRKDGPQRRMVADYRHFVDQLIHFFYQAAADRIRSIDPHHLISFRMTVTSDPTFDGSDRMPYDFPGVAASMDFMAPEGYGRIGDWMRVRPGIFTVAYARACAPGKPVVWAEAGTSTWDARRQVTGPENLEFQRQFYADFYRMVLESYSNGVVWWWYPGGYRVNERSDFGIINPDGTDRPVTRVIRQFAPRVLAPRTIPTPDIWIELDRDADARGLHGAYERVQAEFWNTIEAGKHPGLKKK